MQDFHPEFLCEEVGHGRILTVVDDALVQKLLHDLDGRVSVRGLLVLNEPVDELLGHEAVGVRAQVVPPVLDHLPLVEPQPDRQRMGGHQRSTAHSLQDRLEGFLPLMT